MALQLLNVSTTITVRDADLEDVAHGDPDTRYTIRQITPAQNREVAKRHTVTRRTGPETDYQAVLDDLLDLVLVDWSGIEDGGVPMPCTREHKLRLDQPRKQAIVMLAAQNRIARAEVRDASFREP